VHLVQHGTDELLAQVIDGHLDLCVAAPLSDRVTPELEAKPLAAEPSSCSYPNTTAAAGACEARAGLVGSSGLA
jgi:DNA-binding transcriptional LysR family regulator